MNDLLNYMQLLMQYAENNAENLSPASQQAIAQLLAQIQEVIIQLSQQEQQPPTIQAPANIPEGMPSSNVAGMQYDDQSGNLFVQFLGKHPNRNGPIYAYPDVPPVIAELLQSGAVPARTDGKNAWGRWWKGKVPSAGASVFTLLKNRNMPYQRLT